MPVFKGGAPGEGPICCHEVISKVNSQLTIKILVSMDIL